jgi:hypothetical protein
MKDVYIKLVPVKDKDFQTNPEEEILVQLTKMDEKGISIFIPEQEIEGTAKDAVSLEEFDHIITTYPIERRYYTSIPEEEDPEMVEKIHTGTFEVDITPIINEAIFLNIPYSFHKDSNPNPSSFTTDKDNSSSPFAKLKDYKNT